MTGKEIAAILAILGLVSIMFVHRPIESKSEFQIWKEKFGVKYDSMFEEAYRERIFNENLAEINAHNDRSANGIETYTKGVNQFTGMTQEEFEQNYLGLVIPSEDIVADSVLTTDIKDHDWRNDDAVTPIKNQGQCGSCWAFSATGALEGLSKLADKKSLENFSEQQLVDCSTKYGNHGCSGGLMDNAFKYVKDHGIVHEDEYPYKAVQQKTCQDISKMSNFKITGFTDIKNCNTLATAINDRPISVAVDASNWSSYRSGVFSNCGTRLNHGVLLIGGKGGNWLVKNSWGGSWGEAGTIEVKAGNTCGICNVASYPTK